MEISVQQGRLVLKTNSQTHFTFASLTTFFLWGIYFSTTKRDKKKQIIQCTKGTVKNA